MVGEARARAAKRESAPRGTYGARDAVQAGVPKYARPRRPALAGRIMQRGHLGYPVCPPPIHVTEYPIQGLVWA